MNKVKKIIFISLISLVLLCFIFVVSVNIYVSSVGKSLIQTKFSEKNSYDCILVLGAGLKEDGSPSEILQDRLQGAINLYQMGVSEVIVLSGDCSGASYDEVTAMVEFCLDQEIPKEAIVRDDVGYSTFESMNNVIREKGYQRIVVVTQRYHLYRALYIARAMGADAVGFPSDYHIYGGQIFRDFREIPARVKDFLAVTFFS